MDLLEIVREWLIDLTMAVHIEERRRGEDKDGIKSFPVYLMEVSPSLEDTDTENRKSL